MILRERLTTLRQSGCIVLVTTHDLETIEGIIDRAIVLQNGVAIQLAGGSASLRERERDGGISNVLGHLHQLAWSRDPTT